MRISTSAHARLFGSVLTAVISTSCTSSENNSSGPDEGSALTGTPSGSNAPVTPGTGGTGPVPGEATSPVTGATQTSDVGTTPSASATPDVVGMTGGESTGSQGGAGNAGGTGSGSGGQGMMPPSEDDPSPGEEPAPGEQVIDAGVADPPQLDASMADPESGDFPPEVTVQLALTRQEMAGFGINNNWQPAWTDQEADLLFGTGPGQLGMTILRIGMNPNGGPYNGADCWSDIEKATERGAQYVIGTLWSPPARMKSNNSITGGGRLLPEYYEEWSDTIAAFPAQVKQNTGVDLYGMSPQNETDFASCGFDEPCNGNYDTTVFTGAEYAEFAAIVGPKLHALDPPVKLISPEASEWIHVWSNESGCCSIPGNLGSSDPLNCGFPATNCTDYNDGYQYGYALYHHPTAWQYVDILGTHQYDTQVAEPWPDDVPDRKPVWQTEMSGVKWWPEQGPSTHIENGVAVAGWIHNALTVGEASAWLWWWYRALGDTNEGFLLADGTVAKRQWTFGNYSRFIRPGYTRVEITGEIPEGIEATGFVGPDGTVVVVAINHDTAAVELPITISGGTVPASMTPHVTSASDDLAAKSPVTVTDGIFSASLPAVSVTTFVSD